MNWYQYVGLVAAGFGVAGNLFVISVLGAWLNVIGGSLFVLNVFMLLLAMRAFVVLGRRPVTSLIIIWLAALISLGMLLITIVPMMSIVMALTAFLLLGAFTASVLYLKTSLVRRFLTLGVALGGLYLIFNIAFSIVFEIARQQN